MLKLSSFPVSLVAYIAVAVAFVGFGFLTSKLLGSKSQPGAAYESGEEPVGNAWVSVQPRYLIVAIVFLLFEVELAFLFPWAAVWLQKDLGTGWLTLAAIEGGLFVLILAVGLLYVYGEKLLVWPGPVKKKATWNGVVDRQAYMDKYPRA
jgi:NADH-quinone oxidoreductase subunit A